MEPIEPMLARTVEHLPTGERLLYEPKWDGFRAVAGTGPVEMYSRNGRRLHTRFPEVAEALREQLPTGVVLDGEIIRWSDDGRLDFGALLRRNGVSSRRARQLARSEPCHYVVFDLLALAGRSLTHRSLEHRRAELERLMELVAQPSPLTLGWQTGNPDVALQWWREMPAVGVEGVMVKDGGRSYRPGRRDWRKYKHRVTTEAIVGGTVGEPDRPRALILGRTDPETGELHIAGRTLDLTDDQAHELGPFLTKADRGDHPWPKTLPPSWGQTERQRYVQVVPETVVEICPDTATLAGRWRHLAEYVRPRTDLRPRDVPAGLEVD
ncbi:ATP-dependent DNA ligase [Nocardiopsis salina]|uniref:ATP-dependent DNA ligase n=1 Tax=Nocardiopsis salina TaxID=245836 RepID=UPI0003473940|nr:ATP-dependent DNA ligase [Nocardiopsis salina]